MNSNGISLKTKNYNVTNLKNSFFSRKDRACALLEVCKSKSYHAIAFGLLFTFYVLSLFLCLYSFFVCVALGWIFSVVQNPLVNLDLDGFSNWMVTTENLHRETELCPENQKVLLNTRKNRLLAARSMRNWTELMILLI